MYMTSVAAKRPGVSAAEIPAVGTPLITSDPDLELPLGARDDHISSSYPYLGFLDHPNGFISRAEA